MTPDSPPVTAAAVPLVRRTVRTGGPVRHSPRGPGAAGPVPLGPPAQVSGADRGDVLDLPLLEHVLDGLVTT